ncbi:hypothetical protein ACHAWT_003396 [Skeletonema menzelii]
MPLSSAEITSLLERVDHEIASAQEELRHARPIAEAAGLSVHSSVLDPSYQAKLSASGVPVAAASTSLDGSSAVQAASEQQQPLLDLQQEAALVVKARESFNPLRGTLSAYPLVLSTTGGYSNDDHIIPYQLNSSIDKLSEYKRAMKRRHRQIIIGQRGVDRWDLPRRIPGGRRRRIKRDVDHPSAPPDPPNSGYVMFVSQMTTKLRHDNPHRLHNQINAVKKISALWKAMSEGERGHYKLLAKDATREYEDRLIEYRATGSWTPYCCVERLTGHSNKQHDGGEVDTNRVGNQGPWVRRPYEEKNELEKELEGYEQVIFPPRPKEMEEEHERKVRERKARRKRKVEEEGFRWE